MTRDGQGQVRWVRERPMWLLYKDSESRGASVVTEAHRTVGGNALRTFHDHSIPYHLCLERRCPPCLTISDEIVNMHVVQLSHTLRAHAFTISRTNDITRNDWHCTSERIIELL